VLSIITLSVIVLSVIVLSVIVLRSFYASCHYPVFVMLSGICKVSLC
jgi:hypothetical protein